MLNKVIALSAACVAGATLSAEAKGTESRPNVLLLLADDMGYGELGCYGQEIIKTPVLDKLASEGVRFTDFHAGNSVSSASRAVLMTGKHAGVNTIRGNMGHQMPNGATRVALRKDEIVIPEMLREVGYQTAFVGKWHLEDPCDLSTWAFNRGFDFAAQEQWADAPCAGAYTEHVEYINGLQDSLIYDEKKWDCKDEFRTQIAFDYFDRELNPDKPLFLFMSYRAPHAHEWYINNKELYADKGWPETERMHAAKVTLLDKQIGRMLERLDSLGMMENTLVIITSDNGPQNEGHDYEFFNSNGAMKGFKRDMYEGGHRVPCIVYWKGKIESGLVTDYIGSGQDIMATIADAVGIKAPKQTTGQSLLPVLRGEKGPKREASYWEIYDSGFSRQAVRMGDWKAVQYAGIEGIQLFNLREDFGETLDVSAENPDVMRRIAPLFKSMRTENKYFPSTIPDQSKQRFLTTKVRKQTLFNNGWKFSREDNPDFREVEFDDSAWRKLTLPHDWSIEEEFDPNSKSGGNAGFFKEGIGWYRKEFTVDESQKDRMLTVQFDGVFMNSEVWINGVFLGRRPYGYSTFQYDMTKYLNFEKGAKNILAVRVDNSLPKATRWYNGSGIYRNVHLIETNYTHFRNYDGVYITTPVATTERAVVNVDYKIMANYITEEEVANAAKNTFSRVKTPHNCEIKSIIYDEYGREISRTVEAKIINTYDKYVEHTQQVEFKNPKLWSAAEPNLYYLRSEITLDHHIIDEKVTRFGVRELEYNKDRGLLVNGEQVKLKGICMHHDAGSVGAAVPEDILRFRLEKLKEMGCNAIRTSHNPFAPEFYALCDEMGFYVFDEAFDEWRDDWRYNPGENPVGKAQNGYHLYFEQWAETDLVDMIHRDRNHPSVIMYGIGNEIPFNRNPEARFTVRELVSICKREDPTRPVSLGNDSSHFTTFNGVDEELELMGYNYIMRQHPDSLYAANRRIFPDKLFFGSETGGEVPYFLAYRDNDYVLGQFIWTGFDYLGESRVAPKRGSTGGLLDVTGNPHYEGYLFDCLWNDTPQINITACMTKDITIDSMTYKHGVTYMKVANTDPTINYERSWNWERGENMLVSIYNNCDEVELRLNGRSLGRKATDPDKYQVLYELPYTAGTIEAIGYRNRKVVCRDVIKSAGEPKRIDIEVSKRQLKADGQSVSIIEVAFCDAQNVKNPTATNNVQVECSGAVKFIGMDSGDMYFDGIFKSPNRDAHRGRLIIYVQSNGKTGKGVVELKSEGLPTRKIEIDVVR